MTKILQLYRTIPINTGGSSFCASVNDLASPVTFQYAYPNMLAPMMNTNIESIGLFIFILSFFFVAFNRFISLYFDTVIVLKNITAIYITAKYMQVFMQAACENANLNSLISASNIFATSTDINCDANIPNDKSNCK